MIRFFKILGAIAAIVVSLVVITLLAAIAINWRDVSPSADYVRLQQLIRARPAVADRDNAFIYALGIRAPAGADPQEVGARRNAWLEVLDHDIARLKEDPLVGEVEFSDLRSLPVAFIFKACDADEPHDCPASFDDVPGPERWSDADRLLLERYKALTERRLWREHVGNDVSQPLPTFADITAGQRLLLVSLRGVDAPVLREALSRDLAFWSTMLASSDTLISKLIAVAGLRQHFQFGSMLLRRVGPADRMDAIPPGWRAELTRAELSFERPLAGEQVQMQKIWDMSKLTDDEGRPRHVPFFQPQDIQNELAAGYVEVVAAFDVPLAEYPRVVESLAQRPPRHPFPSRLYDVGGDYLRQLGTVESEKYPPRVAAAEAWRRAALATAELRARGVPPADMATELAKDLLRNPFNGAPFAWGESEQAVIYEGTDHPSVGRRRQVYPY